MEEYRAAVMPLQRDITDHSMELWRLDSSLPALRSYLQCEVFVQSFEGVSTCADLDRCAHVYFFFMRTAPSFQRCVTCAKT